MPITYTKINDTTYTGTVYLDAMIDEDYYGKGMCRWQFISTKVVLKSTGAQAETGFAPGLEREEMMAQEPVTTYLQKKFYPRDLDIEDFPVFGQTDRSKMAAVKDDELFTITLTPKEGNP